VFLIMILRAFCILYYLLIFFVSRIKNENFNNMVGHLYSAK
jgi:hypothetical protein